MESAGEILRRIALSTGIPVDGTVTSSATDADVEPEPTCKICNDVGYVRLDVPYGHPEFGRARPCRCQRVTENERRHEALVRYSNLGPLARCTFASLVETGHSPDPIQQERFRRSVGIAREFAESNEGWLVLTGPSGCGKTHLAAAIANRALERGIQTFFTIVPDLLDHLRGTFHPESGTRYDELFELVRTVPLLVLDDLGTQHETAWAQEKLFQIVNHRYNAQLPTVITTNLVPEEMPERLRTRLTDVGLCQVVYVQNREPAGEEQLRRLINPPFLGELNFDTFKLQLRHLTVEQLDNLRFGFNTARQFARNPNGWLVLQGDCGVGKSHLAAAIVNELRAATGSGNGVYFVVVPDLLDHLRRAFSPDSRISYDVAFDLLRDAKLLVLDDLGAQVSTPWASEKLFQLLNHRYNNRLPTVVTMNCGLAELDTRLASRMADTRISQNLVLRVPDYRSDRSWQQQQPTRPPARKPRG